MPLPIIGPHGPAGVATYQLGNDEEWSLESVTFVVNMDNANSDDTLIIDARSAQRGLIGRQIVDFIHFTSAYSLSLLSEPMYLDTQASSTSFPQGNSGVAAFVTERLTPVTLTAGCVLNVYASSGAPTPGTDPLASLDTGVVIEDLHLWVEPTNAAIGSIPGVGNPILLGIGA